MPSTILSDNGVSSGSAGLKTTASNDGILALQTSSAGGTATTAVTIDTSQNVGVGTSSPAQKLQVLAVNGTGFAGAAIQNQNTNVGIAGVQFSSDTTYFKSAIGHVRNDANGVGSLVFYNASSTGAANWSTSDARMTLDSAGRLGVGTTSPAVMLDVVKNQNALTALNVFNNDSTNASSIAAIRVGYDSTYHYSISRAGNSADIVQNATQSSANLIWQIGSSEKARIDSSGNLLVGTTTASYKGFQVNSDANGNYLGYFRNTGNSTPYGVYIHYPSAAPNNSLNEFFYCQDSSAVRAIIRSNGGLSNYSANNTNLSDRREKTNFAPAKSYLDVICAIPVQTFNYIDQNLEEDDGLTLGVVAQDVQAVAPELVTESNWAGKDEEPKMRLSIYQTDLQYALMKAIQELNAKVDAQAAEIAALKGN